MGTEKEGCDVQFYVREKFLIPSSPLDPDTFQTPEKDKSPTSCTWRRHNIPAGLSITIMVQTRSPSYFVPCRPSLRRIALISLASDGSFMSHKWKWKPRSGIVAIEYKGSRIDR